MYFSFWNTISYPAPWQYFIPIPQTSLPIYTAFPSSMIPNLQHNNTSKKESQQKNDDKTKKLIELSKQDLMKAGYESTKKLWSQGEDQLLLKLVNQDKVQWKQIEKHIPQRTQKMCYSRYRRLSSQTKQSWTKEEDDKIKQLVAEKGQQWKQFPKHFKSNINKFIISIVRSSKQIKQRYMNYLRLQIKRDHWSLQEDMKIISCINKYGKKWKQIEKEMANRTDNQIKNRYYGRLKILYKNKLIKERRKSNAKSKKTKIATVSLPTARSLDNSKVHFDNEGNNH